MEHLDYANLNPLPVASQNMPLTDGRALVLKRLKEKITRKSAGASSILGHSEVGRVHQTVQHSNTNIITAAESCNFQLRNKGTSEQQVTWCSHENTKFEAIPGLFDDGQAARVHQRMHLNSTNITSLDANDFEYQPSSGSEQQWRYGPDKNNEQANVQRSNICEGFKKQTDGSKNQAHVKTEDPRSVILRMSDQTDLNQLESLNQTDMNHPRNLIVQTFSNLECLNNTSYQEEFQGLTNQTEENILTGIANQELLHLEVGAEEVSQTFHMEGGMQTVVKMQDEDLVLHHARRDIETAESFIRGQCPLSFVKTEVQVHCTDVLSPESPALQKENVSGQELTQSSSEPSALQEQNLNQSPTEPSALQKQTMSGQEANQSPSELSPLQQNLRRQEPNQSPTKLCADTPYVKDETDDHQEPNQAPTELCGDLPFVKCETDGSQSGTVLMHQAGTIVTGSSTFMTSKQNNTDVECKRRMIRLKRSGYYSHEEDTLPAATEEDKEAIPSSSHAGRRKTGESPHEYHDEDTLPTATEEEAGEETDPIPSSDAGRSEAGESAHEAHTSGKMLFPGQILASLQIFCQKLPYCDQCHLAFSTQSDFVKHKRKIHPLCRYCQKTFKYSSTLPDHEKGCRILYTCSICQNIFHKAILRVQHELTHRTLLSGIRKIYNRRLEKIQCPVSKAYMCWVCGKRFRKYSSCWQHKVLYHPDRNRNKSRKAKLKGKDDDKEPSETKPDHDDMAEIGKILLETDESAAAKNDKTSVEKNQLDGGIENKPYHVRNCTDGMLAIVCNRESAGLQTNKSSSRNSEKEPNTLNTNKYVNSISEMQDKRMKSDNLTCKTCGLTFNRSFNLKRHMLLHSDNKVNCSKCGRGFSRLDNMKSHRVCCHRACRYCRDRFNSKEECDRHEESCTTKVISNARVVEEVSHENEEEGLDGISKRDDSDEDWTPTSTETNAGVDSSDDDFQIEKKLGTNSDDYACTACGKSFGSKYLLNRHMLSHSVKRQFICCKCSKSLSSKYHLKRHETFCKHLCRFCRRKFDSEEGCTKHEEKCIVALHFDGNSKHRVSFCGDSRHGNINGNDKYLDKRNHQKSHGDDNKIIVSDNQNKRSAWIGDDDNHDQHKMGDTLNSNNVSNIGEEGIEEIFKRKDTDEDWTPTSTGRNAGSDSSEDDFQTEKKQAIKSDEYTCTTCGKSFGRKHLLNRHMLIHSNKRQFVCSKCDKSFYRTDSWKRHEKTCKHSCRFCRKKFDCEEECSDHEETCIVGLHCDGNSKHGVSFQGNSNHGNKKDLNEKSPNSSHGDSSIVGNNHNKFSSAWINDDEDNDLKLMGDFEERKDGGEVKQGQSSINLCKLCGSTFARRYGLLRHLRTHTDRAYRCQKCGKVIKSKDQLVSHQLACVDKFSCKYCDAEFNSSKDGFVHERVHESHLYKHKCRYCAKEFKDRRKCSDHEKRHHCDPVICDTCGKSCKSKELLWYHVKTYHKPKEHLCSFCGEAFTTNALRQTHETRVHSQNDVSFKCDTCEKGFKYKEYLTRHIKLSHTNATKPYLCQHCGHRTNSKPHLRDHMKKHFAPTLKCRFCDKCFTKKELLKYHEATHTGFKAYKCRFCESSFASPNGRLMHEKVHKNEKRHECQICSKRFNLPHHLHQHMKVHSEERPHKCEICGAGFKIRHHLAQHMGTHNKTGRKKY